MSALIFIVSTAATIVKCASMSTMGCNADAGGWTMSMAWMRMAGQTWSGAAASFLGMWIAMMAAMMLPSLAPMLWRYQEAVGGNGEIRLGLLTVQAGVAYSLVWTVFGLAVFALGAALAAAEMQRPALARAVPISAGWVVLLAGALQFTQWKAHHLACCREAPGRGRLPADARPRGVATRSAPGAALQLRLCRPDSDPARPGRHGPARDGARDSGRHAERLAPDGERVARAIGAVAAGAGAILIARAAGLRLTAFRTFRRPVRRAESLAKSPFL